MNLEVVFLPYPRDINLFWENVVEKRTIRMCIFSVTTCQFMLSKCTRDPVVPIGLPCCLLSIALHFLNKPNKKVMIRKNDVSVFMINLAINFSTFLFILMKLLFQKIAAIGGLIDHLSKTVPDTTQNNGLETICEYLPMKWIWIDMPCIFRFIPLWISRLNWSFVLSILFQRIIDLIEFSSFMLMTQIISLLCMVIFHFSSS